MLLDCWSNGHSMLLHSDYGAIVAAAACLPCRARSDLGRRSLERGPVSPAIIDRLTPITHTYRGAGPSPGFARSLYFCSPRLVMSQGLFQALLRGSDATAVYACLRICLLRAAYGLDILKIPIGLHESIHMTFTILL